MATLQDFARVIRSKNATPFYLTLDVFFENDENYNRVKNSGALTPELLSKLYKVPLDYVKNIHFIDSARALKIVMLKRIPSGDPGFLDIYGMQQNIPLLSVEIPTNH